MLLSQSKKTHSHDLLCTASLCTINCNSLQFEFLTECLDLQVSKVRLGALLGIETWTCSSCNAIRGDIINVTFPCIFSCTWGPAATAVFPEPVPACIKTSSHFNWSTIASIWKGRGSWSHLNFCLTVSVMSFRSLGLSAVQTFVASWASFVQMFLLLELQGSIARWSGGERKDEKC